MDSYLSIYMSPEVFASVNVPCSAVSILLDIFFVYCMVVPQPDAEQLDGTLKVLLGSLIGCNATINFCSFLIALCEFALYNVINNWSIFSTIIDLIFAVMMYSMMTTVTSCHWRNMFYFCQIVPLQHAFFIWFKRYIRVFIYSALILNAVFCLYGMTVEISYADAQLKYNLGLNISNDTEVELWDSIQVNKKIKLGDFWTRLGLFLFSLCLMLASSAATVLYLWRHMKNVEESGLSSPRLHRQIKIIIAGITMQALLHFLCSDGIIIIEIVSRYCMSVDLDWNGYIVCTMISLYSSGTTINMGVSQSLFRHRMAHVWQKLRQGVKFV